MFEIQVEVMKGHGTACLVLQHSVQAKPARYRCRRPAVQARGPYSIRPYFLVVELASVVADIPPSWFPVPHLQPARQVRHCPSEAPRMLPYWSRVGIVGELGGGLSRATHEQKRRRCKLERESWLIAWCPGTPSYISATTPKDSLTLFLVVWRRWDQRFDPSLTVPPTSGAALVNM